MSPVVLLAQHPNFLIISSFNFAIPMINSSLEIDKNSHLATSHCVFAERHLLLYENYLSAPRQMPNAGLSRREAVGFMPLVLP